MWQHKDNTVKVEGGICIFRRMYKEGLKEKKEHKKIKEELEQKKGLKRFAEWERVLQLEHKC